MTLISKSLLLLALSLSANLCAQTPSDSVSPAEKKAVTKAVEKISKNVDRKIPITAITKSPMPGVLQVTSDMNIFYVTDNGEFAFVGDLIGINSDLKDWSLTENAMREVRAQALAGLNQSDMIIYPATAPKIAHITVFTDIDCSYCRKMQELMPEYNKQGIEVRYLAFPRAGPKSKTFENTVKVWCAKDKAAAYVAAVVNDIIPKDNCRKNPVASQFELGQKMGVNGTPTLILENGLKIGGMVEPKQLLKIIKEQK